MLDNKFCSFIKFVIIFNLLGCYGSNKTEHEMDGYIVGGQEVKIDRFPHSVFITAYCSPELDEYWKCGASVLNQRILLTAGHCVYECSGSFHIDCIVGTANIDHINVMRKVQKFVIHGKYNYETDLCDIALCMINGNLPLGNKIKRVIIKPSFPARVIAEVAGWGVINEQEEETSKLKSVQQVVRPTKACGNLNIRSGMMCVSSGSPYDYPAVGDSGSALVTNTYQQIGLVSFKSQKKQLSMIVYTNVSYFYNWIQVQSRRLWCSKGRR